MGLVVETPVICDLGNALPVLGRVQQCLPAFFQPALQDVAHQGRAFIREQAVDMACAEAGGGGNQAGIQVLFVQVGFNELFDTVQGGGAVAAYPDVVRAHAGNGVHQ